MHQHSRSRARRTSHSRWSARRTAVAYALACLAAAVTLVAERGAKVPAETLLDRAILEAIDQELSGVAAKDHVSLLPQLHRVPASPVFHDAVAYVMGRANACRPGDVH